jgi:hypothetical protein
MKRIFIVLFFIAFLGSCSDKNDKAATAENAFDAAGMFLHSVLDGKFDEAKKMMVQDEENIEWLDETEKKYVRLPGEEKRNMRESDPTIYETRKLSDSISIIYYSNSYNNRKDSVKLVKTQGTWLVDLKYTFPTADQPKNVQ